MSRARDQDTSAHACPRGRIDAIAKGRVPLSPQEKTLVAALKTLLAKSGVSASEAGRRAGIDPGDARRVLSFGPSTPRTLRRLFETFNLSGYEKLNEAERRAALTLEIHAAAEYLAELLGKQAAMALSDPPGL